MLRKGVRGAAGLALAATFCFAAVADASAEERIRWKMHSAFASNLAILGPAGKRIEKTINEISNGQFQLKFFEPGALVPGIAYLDPVSQGSLDAGYGTPGYHAGKEPALSFFTAVPFGPGFGEFNAWLRYGGGNELLDEIYARYNVKGLICGMIPPEASGWFRKEIKTLDDLKGLKMRFFGLGARVMEKFGVSTQLLAGGDIYPALELGTIDATEFSMPAMDESLGFFQVAKHYYFPGWHQPVSTGELIMPKPKYDALSTLQKDWLRVMCGYQMVEEFSEGEAIQGPAIDRMVKNGTQLHVWPQEVLDKFSAAWQEVAAEESAKSETFKKVWANYSKFRTTYAAWRERGYLKQ
jgi:TRAP-type mannitol/chloroaromatic compound transport system substrate-binding protein